MKYRDYLQAIGAGRRELSFNAIAPAVRRDAEGRPVPPPAPGPIRLHPDEIARLLRPYVSVRFMDQVRAVVPLALYLGLAWDAGAVTTGPITVPLVLAMGIGLGNATQAVEGFGILCLASIGPIISVLVTGLWTRMKACSQERAARAEPPIQPEQEVQALA